MMTTLARLVMLVIFASTTGCAVQFGPDFTATAFMSSYEHGATTEGRPCSMVCGEKPEGICTKTTWRTFNRRPWGTSENTAVVTESSEVIGQKGKGISGHMAGVVEDIAGKVIAAFVPGGAVVATLKDLLKEDVAGAEAATPTE